MNRTEAGVTSGTLAGAHVEQHTARGKADHHERKGQRGISAGHAEFGLGVGSATM